MPIYSRENRPFPFKIGQTIELEHSTDPQFGSLIKKGDRGIINDITQTQGEIIAWIDFDSGVHLGLVYRIDQFKIID
jgi:hypothetical protein